MSDDTNDPIESRIDKALLLLSRTFPATPFSRNQIRESQNEWLRELANNSEITELK